MKSKHKRLPLHSWEAHPKANKKDAHKQLTIVVVTIGAIVVLALLLFLGQKQFAGKAWYTEGDNTIGITNPGTIFVEEPFTLTVKANLGDKNTVGINFILNYSEGLECTEVKSLLGWGGDAIIHTATCDTNNNKIIFEYGTTNYMLPKTTGDIEIANITFISNNSKKYNLHFEKTSILDLATSNYIPIDVIGAEIEIFSKTGPGCGNGIIESDEFCDGTSFSGLVEGCIDKGFPIGGAPTCKDACTSVDYSSCQKSQKGQECVLDPVGEMESTCAAGLKCEENDDEKLVCVSAGVEICDGNDNDGDGWIDIIPGNVQIQGDQKFPQNVTALCTTNESCGTFNIACSGNSWCYLSKDYSKGALCVCKEGWQSCGGSSCGTSIKTDFNNCGTCGNVCGAGQSCEAGKCIVSTVTLDKPIDIKLTPIGKPAEIAINSVGKSKDYDIAVTITPDTALPAGYLMIAVVNYGTHQSTKFIDDSNPALSVGSSKTFKFPHTVDSSATNLTVLAMVWNGYLSEGFEWKELVPAEDKPYAIS